MRSASVPAFCRMLALGLLGYGHLREARLSGGALALHARLQTPSFCSDQGRLFFSRQARFFSGGHPNEPGTRLLRRTALGPDWRLRDRPSEGFSKLVQLSGLRLPTWRLGPARQWIAPLSNSWCSIFWCQVATGSSGLVLVSP